MACATAFFSHFYGKKVAAAVDVHGADVAADFQPPGNFFFHILVVGGKVAAECGHDPVDGARDLPHAFVPVHDPG